MITSKNLIGVVLINKKHNMYKRDFKFIRVATAIPKVNLGNVKENVKEILTFVDKAYKEGADVVLFPELCVTGYTCQDLFLQEDLIGDAERGVEEIKRASKEYLGLVIIVGAPVRKNGFLLNAAVVIQNEDMEVIGKRNLPGYKEFYEERWFTEDSGKLKIFETEDFKFGVEVCEDVWAPLPPSVCMAGAGAEIIFNLSASTELVGKTEYLKRLLQQHSEKLICGYSYVSCGFGESSQDVVFLGKTFSYENGKEISKPAQDGLFITDFDLESLRNERRTNTTFCSFARTVTKRPRVDVIELDPTPAYKNVPETMRTWNGYPFANPKNYQDILSIQTRALAKRLQHTGLKPVIGVSGGSDSTWALLVAVDAMKYLGRPVEDIIGITMPGFATSKRTFGNSLILMEALGIAPKVVDIREICQAEMRAIGHDPEVEDVTFENIQARTRTQILMNIANKEGGLVIGTGDMSELALGWCTYNADHMSMYGVNAGVPKTLVKALIKSYGESHPAIEGILNEILSTPVSPELTGTGAEGEGAQVTEDIIGPYELHDFFLYNTLRHGFGESKIIFLGLHSNLIEKYSKDEMVKWYKVFIRRFYSQQFKRSCLPDGPKIGSISLSPRGDLRMPSDIKLAK